MTIANKGYAHPDALVSTEWVAEHLQDPQVRLVESNEDPLVYPSGHIPGAVQIDWTSDLNDPLRRDYIAAADFAALVSRFGITPDTTVVLYGDRNNWWACYAFWVFQLFGHTNARILDGGRLKWEKDGRPLTREVPTYAASTYPVPSARDDAAHRAFRAQVLAHSEAGGQLVDVRSPDEYTGAKLHMPEYPQEGAMRGGHIPGAKSVPWARAINPEDGTFKDAEQLKAIYLGEKQLDPSKETIAYCRIGERSSHTWFTLKYLLGFDHIRNYDGSWTEWGNLVGVPVAKGPEEG
ncbi:sulfurtransferase [Luteitalea sp.]|uniref:sulfurtransferase n=1 Tax=Luteitalea sp. TaxID=2004800 RepID=UPI000A832E4B|nr:sulfurtransferase [Luteitalea sp.]